ncbi:MAG TPA: hemerythrin domain-containing protein [Planctomycetota bacterium]|nr:hemerythrin domain-containing protein [Planctomycetota bacterium]
MPSRSAIALLKEDHKKVRELLEDLAESNGRSPSKRAKLLAEIGHELRVHTQIEEEIFYPAFRDAARKKEHSKLYFEALEEHHVVDMFLPEIESTDPSAEDFPAKAKVLKDLVEHHAREEEREMFPAARELFEREELAELGARLEERKEALLGAAAAS